MTRLIPCAAAVLVLGCQSPPSGLLSPDAATADAMLPAPPDAEWIEMGPALVVDDFHIAGLGEAVHAFALLGQALNPQLETAVMDGTLLLGLELRELDDPSGQNDADLSVGLYTLEDSNDNADNNFDPDAPEAFRPAAGSIVMGEPSVHFTTASIDGGELAAEGVSLFMLPGDLPIPFPLEQLTISGDLVAGGGGEYVRELENGLMIGAVPVSVLAVVPNIAGEMCPGQTLLDVLASGCGFANVQPDVDLDGDGTERFFDLDDDGSIDLCIDGDGTETTGTDCPTGAGFADGYRLVFALHAVRATLLAP